MMRQPRFIDADGRGKAILTMIVYMEGWNEVCGGGACGGGVRLSTGQLKMSQKINGFYRILLLFVGLDIMVYISTFSIIYGYMAGPAPFK